MYEYKAIVKYVHDGDTVTLDIDQGFDVWHHNMHIRMQGINAPELRVGQTPGYEARDFLQSVLPVGMVVLVRTNKDSVDKYGGRYDGTIFTGTWTGDVLLDQLNVNNLMVSTGHAVVYNMG